MFGFGADALAKIIILIWLTIVVILAWLVPYFAC